MTKNELRNWIKRKLGYPMVRVELHDTQIDDCIMKSREEYIKWAVGNATDEVFFTVPLSAGVDTYELPSGVTEIVKVREFDTSAHGINTLFTIENYLYNQGVLAFLDNIGKYSMIDYHMALEFIDLLERYTPNYYSWRYNKMDNTLRVRPTPDFDLNIQVGYLIVDSFMIEGTNEETKVMPDDIYNYLWGKTWVQDYALACAKETLGLIRRKFENFSSIGGQGISLDGDALISEAKEMREKLEERLRQDEESGEGMPIIIG